MIGDVEQVSDVIERVIELARGERTVSPVGARLAPAQADAQDLSDQVHQRERIADADQSRGHLDVEDASRELPRLEQADPQILAGRVHDDLDRRVADHVPEGSEVADRQRVDQGQPLASRHLDQAEHRLERVLGDEFRVEREPAARAQMVD